MAKTIWHGRVGDAITSRWLFSLHRNNSGKIVQWWFGRYEPDDKVVFRQLVRP